MKRSALISLISIVTLAVAGLVAVVSSSTAPQLGLDLQGGVAVILRPTDPDVASADLDQAIEIIRSRVDSLGVAEPDITRQGDRVVIQLPGVTDADRALELVGKTAELRYRPVLGGGLTLPYTNEGAGLAQVILDIDTAGPTLADPNEVLTPVAEITPESTIVVAQFNDTALFVLDEVLFDGSIIESVEAVESIDFPDSYRVKVTLTEQGLEDVNGYSTLNVNRGLVLLFDQRVYLSAPPVSEDVEAGIAYFDELTQEQAEAFAEGFEADSNSVSYRSPAEGTGVFEYSETGAGLISDFFDDSDPLADSPSVTPEQVITSRADDIYEASVILPDLRNEELYAMGPAMARGDIIRSANAQLGGSSGTEWSVSISFTTEGSAEFNAIAAVMVNQRLAIVLDGVVYSAPVIQQSSFQGSAVITGDFSESEAKDLALVLRFGALPVELEQESVQTVSATLGGDALDAGIIAGIVGLFLVGVFMIAYYRVLGIVSILSLSVSGALLWTVISILGETQGLVLSLAGFTGIIVSIGVQVDSNVVYYEKLKEEVRGGQSLRVSATHGFGEAFSTIIKADVASLIGAAVLWKLTVGPVRGFALFLGLATTMDLIVSYFFMQPMVIWVTRRKKMSAQSIVGVGETGTTGGVVR